MASFEPLPSPRHEVNPLDQSDRWATVAARTFSGAASVRVTAAYAVVLVAVSLCLTELGQHAREAVVSRMSTNLHNLSHGRLSTLVGSAFVDDGGDIYVWLPGLVCLLALGELDRHSPQAFHSYLRQSKPNKPSTPPAAGYAHHADSSPD